MLPVLTVLFLVSYGLMTLLIVEQGTTIQAQRTLIQQLLGDSSELSALKIKVKQAERAAQVQSPSAQVQAPTDSEIQAPSTQVAPADKTHSTNKGGKVQRPEPERPPMPASDVADVRRSLMSI